MSRRGYSVDLRERVVNALASGMSQEETARLFSVGVATVYRWNRLKRETNSLEPKPHGRGPEPLLSEADHETILQIVQEKPDRTIPEITVELASRGKKASTSTVSRALLRLGLTFKKRR